MPEPDGLPPTIGAAPASGDVPPWAFRAFAWRWPTVLIGLLPPIVAQASLRFADPAWFAGLPRVSWAVATFLLLLWMLAFPIAAARRHRGPWPRPREVGVELLVTLLATPLVLLAVAGFRLALERLAPGPSASGAVFEPIAGSASRFDPIALVVLAGVVAPLAEEVFFRGMLYNALRRRLHPVVAAVIQGLAFGFLHPFGWREQAVLSLVGVLLAFLYEWRRRLLAPILVHGLANAISLAALFATVAAAAAAPVLGVLGADHPQGCLVRQILPDSPAERAGLRVGDVIQAAGENAVQTPRDLVQVVRSKKAGDRLPVWYLRGGEPGFVEPVLRARPEAPPL